MFYHVIWPIKVTNQIPVLEQGEVHKDSNTTLFGVHGKHNVWHVLVEKDFQIVQGKLTASAVGQIVGLQSNEIKLIASEYAEKVSSNILMFNVF